MCNVGFHQKRRKECETKENNKMKNRDKRNKNSHRENNFNAKERFN